MLKEPSGWGLSSTRSAVRLVSKKVSRVAPAQTGASGNVAGRTVFLGPPHGGVLHAGPGVVAGGPVEVVPRHPAVPQVRHHVQRHAPWHILQPHILVERAFLLPSTCGLHEIGSLMKLNHSARQYVHGITVVASVRRRCSSEHRGEYRHIRIFYTACR